MATETCDLFGFDEGVDNRRRLYLGEHCVSICLGVSPDVCSRLTSARKVAIDFPCLGNQ